jgi:hypothetical protein
MHYVSLWQHYWEVCYPIWQWHLFWKWSLSGHYEWYFYLVFNKVSYYGELPHEFNSIMCKGLCAHTHACVHHPACSTTSDFFDFSLPLGDQFVMTYFFFLSSICSVKWYVWLTGEEQNTTVLEQPAAFVRMWRQRYTYLNSFLFTVMFRVIHYNVFGFNNT